MFALLSKGRKFGMSLDTMLDLFDKIVVPILSYGCEIWSFEDCTIIEKLHLKFCKYLLCLKTSTPNVMVYGETGRFPLYIKFHAQLICFWRKTLQSPVRKISNVCYHVLLNLLNDHIYVNPWLSFVKTTLENLGLGYIWYNQEEFININWLKCTITKIMQDQYISEWSAKILESEKCFMYKVIKTSFAFEQYLITCPPNLVKNIIKIRTCNHNLPIEKGRYNNIPRHECLCTLCNC